MISLKLINGIAERDASKVVIYKWFLIVLLILFVPSTLYSTANGDMEGILTNSKSSLAIQIISEIVITLWMTYQILVIDSLEKMYREQPSSMTQQNVTYQAHPQQQLGQVMITQPYYAPPSQTPYPQNPTSIPSINNYPEKL